MVQCTAVRIDASSGESCKCHILQVLIALMLVREICRINNEIEVYIQFSKFLVRFPVPLALHLVIRKMQKARCQDLLLKRYKEFTASFCIYEYLYQYFHHLERPTCTYKCAVFLNLNEYFVSLNTHNNIVRINNILFYCILLPILQFILLKKECWCLYYGSYDSHSLPSKREIKKLSCLVLFIFFCNYRHYTDLNQT